MSPDDPRHGTPAGARRHWKTNTPICGPCSVAYNRERKRARHEAAKGHPRRTTLGTAAHHVLETYTNAYMAKMTGITTQKLAQYRRRGPDMPVLRSTRDRILAARPEWTPIGIQRRLQALAAIGYSSAMIADAVGSWPTTITRLQRSKIEFVSYEYAERIVAAYNELDHTQQHVPCSSAAARRRAAEHGWPAPAAWDDIDLDDAPATLRIGPRDTLAEFDHLRAGGMTPEQAYTALGVTPKAIERALYRARTREQVA